jgi:hypothetical protein
MCLILSVLFLVGQLVILLDCAYKWSDKWATHEEDKYQMGLFVCSVGITIVGITIVVLSFLWFGASSDCGAHQGMISTVLVAALLYFPLSVWSANGSVLPSAIMFAYTGWTCFAALSMTHGGECNLISTGTGVLQLVFGSCISAVALVYTTVSAGTSRSAFSMSDDEEETVEEAEAASFSFFHMQMMLGSCYLAMLLSGWSILGSDTMATLDGGGDGPMWAKFASVLACIAMYAWSLIAPHCCEDREFV